MSGGGGGGGAGRSEKRGRSCGGRGDKWCLDGGRTYATPRAPVRRGPAGRGTVAIGRGRSRPWRWRWRWQWRATDDNDNDAAAVAEKPVVRRAPRQKQSSDSTRFVCTRAIVATAVTPAVVFPCAVPRHVNSKIVSRRIITVRVLVFVICRIYSAIIVLPFAIRVWIFFRRLSCAAVRTTVSVRFNSADAVYGRRILQ